MDIEKAKEILRILAGGINPITGEVLPKDDSANQIEITRAIYTVLNQLNKVSTSKKYENAGKPWTVEEEEILCKMYDDKMPKKEIVKTLKRSTVAIQARLVKLGKIDNRYEF